MEFYIPTQIYHENSAVLKHSAEINNHHFLFYEDYKKNNSNTPK